MYGDTVKPRTSSICQVLRRLRSRLIESTSVRISPTEKRSVSFRTLLLVTLKVEAVGTSAASVSGRPATSQASSPPFSILTRSRGKPQ